MGEAPDGGGKAIGFNTEYFSGKRLIDVRVAIVAVRGTANRSAIVNVYIAPGEVLRLTPIMRREGDKPIG